MSATDPDVELSLTCFRENFHLAEGIGGTWMPAASLAYVKLRGWWSFECGSVEQSTCCNPSVS
jgi:hypothetical protein